jgi:hypothetical protein
LPAPLAAPLPAPLAAPLLPAPPRSLAFHEYSLPVSLRLDTDGELKAAARPGFIYG